MSSCVREEIEDGVEQRNVCSIVSVLPSLSFKLGSGDLGER
jgi:hypothetical protein